MKQLTPVIRIARILGCWNVLHILITWWIATGDYFKKSWGGLAWPTLLSIRLLWVFGIFVNYAGTGVRIFKLVLVRIVRHEHYIVTFRGKSMALVLLDFTESWIIARMTLCQTSAASVYLIGGFLHAWSVNPILSEWIRTTIPRSWTYPLGSLGKRGLRMEEAKGTPTDAMTGGKQQILWCEVLGMGKAYAWRFAWAILVIGVGGWMTWWSPRICSHWLNDWYYHSP